MTHSPTLVLAMLAVLTLCAGGVAQEDVAEREFAERKELHAAAPAVGTRVPDLVLVSLEGRPVALSSLRGRVVVLIKAGFTCPLFRRAAAGLRQLQNVYAGSRDVTFLVVEQKEPHAGRMAFEDVEQPATFAERCALAERIRDELEVTMPIYVDGMDGASRALFSDLPSPAFLIDREGRIADKLPWADPEPLGNAITRVLRDEKPVRWPADGPCPFEERDAAMRRAVLAGNPILRIRWSNDEVVQTLDARAPAAEQARRAMTRAWLFSGRKTSDRLAAIAAVAPAIEAAWSEDPMRLLAARVEFAELLASRWDGSGWATLAANPPASADERVRAWLQAQHTAFEEPLLAFDEATRARVRKQLKEHAPMGYDPVFHTGLALVRVRFTEEGIYVVRGAGGLGLREGDRLELVGSEPGDPAPLTAGERNALVLQTMMISKSRVTRLLAIAEK